MILGDPSTVEQISPDYGIVAEQVDAVSDFSIIFFYKAAVGNRIGLMLVV